MADILIPLSGFGGLSPTYSGYPTKESPTPNLDPFADDQRYTDGLINPFRQPGFLSAACDTFQTLTAGTSYIGIISATQVDDVNSRHYMIERAVNPHIFEMDFTGETQFESSNVITAAAGGGTDLEIYSVNGTRSLFYTYRKTGGGGGDMGRYNFSSFVDTYLSATATNGFNLNSDVEHKMIVADNGYMYILDNQDVHRLDGTANGGANGTAYPRLITFVSPFQLVDGIDAKGFLWLAIVGSTRSLTGTDQQTTTEIPCGVYVWNRQTTRINMADFIPIPGTKEIRKIFYFEGTPWIISVSANRTTQIRQYNGREFEVKFELHRDAQPRFSDSVQVRGMIVYWIGRNDGKIYALGRIYQDGPLGIHIIGDISDNVAETFNSGGAISIAGGRPGVTSGDYLEPETMVINFSTGSTENYARRFFPHSLTITGLTLNSHEGNFRTVVKHLPKLSDITGVTLVYPELASGSNTALSLQVLVNRSSAISATATVSQTDGQRGWVYKPLSIHNVNTVQLGIRFSTAIIISNQITPEYAIIHYQQRHKFR